MDKFNVGIEKIPEILDLLLSIKMTETTEELKEKFYDYAYSGIYVNNHWLFSCITILVNKYQIDDSNQKCRYLIHMNKDLANYMMYTIIRSMKDADEYPTCLSGVYLFNNDIQMAETIVKKHLEEKYNVDIQDWKPIELD